MQFANAVTSCYACYQRCHAALCIESQSRLCYRAKCNERQAHKACQFGSDTIAPKDTIFGLETE